MIQRAIRGDVPHASVEMPFASTGISAGIDAPHCGVAPTAPS
jgi:hypothetical protein